MPLSGLGAAMRRREAAVAGASRPLAGVRGGVASRAVGGTTTKASMTESRTDYLSASFLERVQRSYKLALSAVHGRYGRIWETIDQQRAPVHAALLAETDIELRNIFSNPVSSNLFLGVDPL